MFQISKLSDYSIVLMTYLAQQPEGVHAARDIMDHTHLTLPTVTKLLKMLAKKDLLTSQRGSQGGYSLAKQATEISVADIIEAIEGDLGLTECSHIESHCILEPSCANRQNWQMISHAVHEALAKISLDDMTGPIKPPTIDFSHLKKNNDKQTDTTGKAA